jgi:hypothetical protein
VLKAFRESGVGRLSPEVLKAFRESGVGRLSPDVLNALRGFRGVPREVWQARRKVQDHADQAGRPPPSPEQTTEFHDEPADDFEEKDHPDAQQDEDK